MMVARIREPLTEDPTRRTELRSALLPALNVRSPREDASRPIPSTPQRCRLAAGPHRRVDQLHLRRAGPGC